MKHILLAVAMLLLLACNSDDAVEVIEAPLNEVVVDGDCPSPASIRRDALALSNQARAIARFCGETHYDAVPALNWNNQLEEAARLHSDDMATHNFFSHTGSNGLNPSYRLQVVGYEYRTWAENIYAGLHNTQAAIDGWLKSPGHCANIMNPHVTELGVACVANSATDYGTYWTMVLAAPR